MKETAVEDKKTAEYWKKKFAADIAAEICHLHNFQKKKLLLDDPMENPALDPFDSSSSSGS